MPSRVKQLADQEADRVEAEEAEAAAAEDEHDAEPEPEPQLEPEPEHDAEPEAAAEPLSFEAKGELLAEEAARHDAALRAVFGAEYESFTACPMCSFLGVVAEEGMMLDPDTVRCPQCRGWGQFLTESQVDNHYTRQCPRCMGNGYIDKAFAQPATFEPTNANATVEPSPVVVPPMPVYDPTTNTWRTPDGQPLSAVAS